MITPDRREIVQAVRFIEDEMERLGLKTRSHGTAEKPVQFGKCFVSRTSLIGNNEDGMTPFLRKGVIVNLPLIHFACCRHTAAPMRFASAMSSAS